MNNIAANLERINNRINNACQKAGRDPETVKLIAVSKIKPAEQIEEAFCDGQNASGKVMCKSFATNSHWLNPR